MLLYFSSVIDALSREEYSIMGNMKPLNPKVYRPTLLVPESGMEQRKVGSNKTEHVL